MNDFSSYFTNPNFITNLGWNGKGIVYVENETDISFWESILDSAQISQNYEIQACTNGSSARGKPALKRFFQGANKKVLFAIDSDFDFIAPNHSEDSIAVNSNAYVIQTRTYSMESIKCNHKTLEDVSKKIRYGQQYNWRIADFIMEFSKIIHEPLVIYTYCLENRIDTKLQKNEFCRELIPDEIGNHFNQDALPKFRTKIKELTASLPKIEENTLSKFKEDLSKKNLTEKNCYKFINGHNLLDSIAKPILLSIKREVEKAAIENAKTQYKEGQALNDKIREIRGHLQSKCGIDTLIHCDSHFMKDDHFQEIVSYIKEIAA